MNLNFSQWIQLISLILGGALGTKILTVLVETRDSLRDLGTKEPATGLFKEVNELKEDVIDHNYMLAKLGFDRRTKERRGQ